MNSSCNQYTFEEENYPFLSSENEKNESNLYLRSNLVRFIAFIQLPINQKRATFRSNANQNAFQTVGKMACRERKTRKEGRGRCSLAIRNRLIPLGCCRSQWRGARDRKKGVKDRPSRKLVREEALIISPSATVTKVKRRMCRH